MCNIDIHGCFMVSGLRHRCVTFCLSFHSVFTVFLNIKSALLKKWQFLNYVTLELNERYVILLSYGCRFAASTCTMTRLAGATLWPVSWPPPTGTSLGGYSKCTFQHPGDEIVNGLKVSLLESLKKYHEVWNQAANVSVF